MAKTVSFACILLLNICFLSSVQCGYYSKSRPIKPVQEKKTNLKFYIHDILSGQKPTAVLIARPNITESPNDPTPFGTTFVIDDPLTEGPEITSKLIGNARGIYVSAGQDTFTLVMYIDLGFTSGIFNGSSLSVFSRNPITENPREMAVVGGRGKFRYAKGFVKVRTHYLNVTNGDAILEYDVEVIHP